MKITDIKIRKLFDEERLKALVSVTFDGVLAVHDIRVISGDSGFFIAMPNRRLPDGGFLDIVHPVGSEARDELTEAIMAAYIKAKEAAHES